MTQFQAPFRVILADKSIVEIVNAAGEVTGAITPESFSDDVQFEGSTELQFRSTGILINSPSAGKMAITADGGGADDITLTGGVTIAGILAITGAVSLAEAVTLASDKKFRLRDSGLFIHSPSDGKLLISADGGGADDITLSGGVTVTGNIAQTGNNAITGKLTASVGVQSAAVAVTATVDGATTGVIPDGTTHAEVTSSVSTKIVTLPTPTPGLMTRIRVGANGCKLQSSTPASVAINGGTGASAKTDIAADMLVYAVCKTATKWTLFQVSDVGALTAVTPAA